MAKKHDETNDMLEGVEQTLTQTELFLEKNKKPLGIGVGVVVGLVMLFYAFNEYYTKPLNLEAQNEIFRAQDYLAQDSLRLALEGDGINLGFLDVADEYSSTKVGNMANYYAGVCYLNLGEYQNAIEYLDNFSGSDEVISVLAVASIGDAFLELGQKEDALDYYKKALNKSDNAFVIPTILFKTAQLSELLDEYDAAIKYYNRIKEEFSTSREAADIDKYIARAEARK